MTSNKGTKKKAKAKTPSNGRRKKNAEEIKKDTGFLDKYQYIDTQWFKHFNNNEKVLR